MTVPVRLDFAPPPEPDVVKLHIEEGPSSSGPWNELTGSPITDVGVFPAYISYVTIQAGSAQDWFRIYWEMVGGVTGPVSNAVQGGTTTLIQKIVTRVMQRDPNANEGIVTQEAEWVIHHVMKTNNPYDTSLDPTYDQMEGMTLLTLARTMISSLVSSGSSHSYTAGLVSQKADTGTTANKDLIKYLLDEANSLLGISMSWVMLLEDIDPTGIGTVSTVGVDISRLLVTIE